MGYYGGLRCGELTALEFEDVTIADDCITAVDIGASRITWFGRLPQATVVSALTSPLSLTFWSPALRVKEPHLQCKRLNIVVLFETQAVC